MFSESKFPGVGTDEYVRPPTNHYDPTIEDWLLPGPDLRGSTQTPHIQRLLLHLQLHCLHQIPLLPSLQIIQALR